jgi:hypothetical protein
MEPEQLHTVLKATSTIIITFESEKRLLSYRQMLYKINKQGEYRYRTMRDELSMFGLVIWRMV